MLVCNVNEPTFPFLLVSTYLFFPSIFVEGRKILRFSSLPSIPGVLCRFGLEMSLVWDLASEVQGYVFQAISNGTGVFFFLSSLSMYLVATMAFSS
jgi:hypothetical protein